MTDQDRAPRWPFGARLRVVLAVLLATAASLAAAQAPGRDFDHVRTGFPLTGQHTNERCESCHLNGVFKGTPRDCASCHTAGARWARGNVVKPQNHVPHDPGAADACPHDAVVQRCTLQPRRPRAGQLHDLPQRQHGQRASRAATC